MRSILPAALLLTPMLALAQYKCTGPSGSVSFQQTPCAGSQQQQALILKVAPASSSAAEREGGLSSKPVVEGTVEQRMVRALERERRVRELELAVSQTEYAMESRNGQMAKEMTALRDQKRYANNNLAGATLEQSISSEMQAVAAKYSAMNAVDIERLKQLRVELAAAKLKVAER